MIRRDITRPAGDAWVLIAQIDHARISGELAEAWGGPAVQPLPFADVLLPTIFHHDDGWDCWQQQPTIDPQTGRPRAFTEMPNDVAHGIWRRSIEQVSRWGPLAQYCVARHFMRLRRGGDELDQPGVRDFLQDYDARCGRWLDQWRCTDPAARTAAAAESAVDFLQTFDQLSLLLCCTPRSEPYEVRTPGGLMLTLQLEGPLVAVEPWPWNKTEISLQTSGKVLAAEPLASDEQLRRALADAESTQLSWQLIPAATTRVQ